MEIWVTVIMSGIAMVGVIWGGFMTYLIHRDKLRYDVEVAVLKKENARLQAALDASQPK